MRRIVTDTGRAVTVDLSREWYDLEVATPQIGQRVLLQVRTAGAHYFGRAVVVDFDEESVSLDSDGPMHRL